MSYVWYKMANNVVSSLASAISWTSTSIIVNDWWIFPSEFPYLLTIEQQSEWRTIVREIVKATAKNWNTITIERAVEGCVSDDTQVPKVYSQAPHSFETNSIVSLSMTAWTLQDAQNGITDNANTISAANDEIDTLIWLINTLEEDIWNL